MKILQNFKQKLNKATITNSKKFYQSIDEFPLFNWIKCNSGELEFVNLKRTKTPLNEVKFIELYNQYIERFGLGKELEKYIELKKELINLKLEFVKTGDASLLNQIEIEKAKLSQLDPTKSQGMDINQCLVHLKKWSGHWINTKEITIVEFKYLLEEYVTSNK
jgi:hypothetical protein